jgi:hypothetical protein
MGNLRPIGSEKLEGSEKLKRIMEIARYNEVTPNPINENSSVEYSIKLSDGATYQINKEKTGYVIKKSINEGSFDYIEPMKNRNHYSSYSQAFKRLNLIAKEVNKLVGNDSEISLFSEQKKYTLKTPTPAAAPSTEPSPAPDMDAPAPDMGDEDIPAPDMDAPAPDMDAPAPDMGDDDLPTPDMGGEEGGGEESSMKSIQKLTGKLGQKIRSYTSEEELTSDDAKYIINSILSAIDLSILDDEDKEDIMSKFEGEEDMDSDMDVESPEAPDMGDEEMPDEPEMGGEMAEMDTLGGRFTDKFGSNYTGALSNKFAPHEAEGISKIMDEVFSESKVEKIISKYFKVDEKEKQLIESKTKNKLLIESKKIAQTFKQEAAVEKFVNKYPNSFLIGKSSKNNLVFQLEGTKIRITPEGKIL